MPEAETRKSRRLAVLGVVLLAFLAYVPSLGNGFALDDTVARAWNDGVPNRAIAELRSPVYYFTSDYWGGVRSGLYRPATIYSYALTHNLLPGSGDREALPHHIINLLLNCCAAYFVLWLMLDFGLPIVGAALTSALFAVHAIHSEVVATVVGRAELLSFCFGATGLMAMRKSETGALWLAISGVLFFLAFCSKESALAWAPFVPCYLLARAWRAHPGTTVRDALGPRWKPMLAALVPGLILFFVLRHEVVSGPIETVKYAANPLFYSDESVRLTTALKLWGYGLWLCLAPFSLACLYGPQSIRLVSGGLDFGVAAASAVFAVWLSVALLRARRRPGLFLAAAIFFGFGFITSNVPFAIGTIFAERLYFIPSLGVCMLPALLLRELQPSGRKLLITACVLWASASVFVDVRRSLVWRDNETLLLRESAAHPDCAIVQLTAAKYFHVLEFEQEDRKDFFRARAWAGARRAQTLDPEYVEAFALEAALLEREGEVDAAISRLHKALGMKRLPHSDLEASLRKSLGRLLITEKKELSRGLVECLRSLQLDPSDEELRVRTIDFGTATLLRTVLGKLIDYGLKRNPHSVVLAVQKADFLARSPTKSAPLLNEIAELLRGVFRRLAPKRHGEYRFVVARMQLAECLTALGQVAAARRAYQVIVSLPDVPPPIKAKASQMLKALPR